MATVEDLAAEAPGGAGAIDPPDHFTSVINGGSTLGDLYSDDFFDEAPFNRHSLDPDTDLIVER